jgi:hypothetical protein
MKKILIFFLSFFILFSLSSKVFAATSLTCGSSTTVNTAIGCIDFTNSNVFFGGILRWAVGIGGGIAFLLIIYGGFLVMTSTGDPKRLQAGQELLTSAIGGLILLILSMFILNVIGINVLGLDKFGL